MAKKKNPKKKIQKNKRNREIGINKKNFLN